MHPQRTSGMVGVDGALIDRLRAKPREPVGGDASVLRKHVDTCGGTEGRRSFNSMHQPEALAAAAVDGSLARSSLARPSLVPAV